MDYIDRILEDGEKVVGIGRLSITRFLPHLFVSAFLIWASDLAGKYHALGGRVVFWLGVFMVLWVVIKMITSKFVATDKRAIFKSGFIYKKWIEIRYSRVESVNFNQKLFTKFISFGDITIISTGQNETIFKGIKNPAKFKQSIDKALSDIFL